MNNKIGKVTVYVNDQEQAKIFWMNKVVFFDYHHFLKDSKKRCMNL